MRRDFKIEMPIAVCLIVSLIFCAIPAAAHPPVAKPAVSEILCSIISREARQQGLPESFLARLIWKESLFNPNAVSPKGAQGIAQFMPGTANERGLSDPFLAAEAIAASAHLLADLRDAFGNLGLAAAAYNAGEDRVRAWLQGLVRLPIETLDYVLFITGRPASDWMQSQANFAMPSIGKGEDFARDCAALAGRQAKPPAAPMVASGDWKPWGAQLAGAANEGAALAAFERLQKLHASVLAGVTPLIIRKRTPGMGRAMRIDVRIGTTSRVDAEQFCGKLRARGGACIVLRN